MKELIKKLMIILIIIGIGLSVLNFISVDNIATVNPNNKQADPKGTMDADGKCTGMALNC